MPLSWCWASVPFHFVWSDGNSVLFAVGGFGHTQMAKDEVEWHNFYILQSFPAHDMGMGSKALYKNFGRNVMQNTKAW